MRKNQYEEALFRCEDDRFELDMAIECCRSTINAFTRASQQIRNLSQEDRENYRLPRDALADIHVRMVQKIYGIMPGNFWITLPRNFSAQPKLTKNLQSVTKEHRNQKKIESPDISHVTYMQVK